MTTDLQEPRTKNKKEKAYRFLFLNQFVFPDPAPTARLLEEVAAELRARGHETVLVGDRASYHGHKTLFGSRALRELLSLGRLFCRAVFTGRADAIVCLSSPPLLPVVAKLALLRHCGAKLIHWAMDLYPEVAVALGEVREGSLLHRVTAGLMGRVYRSCDLIVTLDDDMAGQIALHGANGEVRTLWPPPFDSTTPNGELPSQAVPRPFVWLYSGNLGRAHEWKTLLDAQHHLEKAGVEIDLVFQGGGAERVMAGQYAEGLGLKRCHWLPYAEDVELIPSLLKADCLIATQRPETKGCLWPSKLALALLLERPILWVGAAESSVTSLLRDSGHLCFVPGDHLQVADAIQELRTTRDAPGRKVDLDGLLMRIESIRRREISALGARIEWMLVDSEMGGLPGRREGSSFH